MSIGIWTFGLDTQPINEVREAAAEIEELGFAMLWFGEYPGREAMTQAALLLAATQRLTIATGIARMDRRDPVGAAAAHRTLSEAYPGRFLLGLGGQAIGNRPVATVRDYLDAMDEAPLVNPAPEQPARRVLAALGPGMLRLAAERADGAHTYFVPVDHTARAREIMGSSAFLGVEQAVVLEPDPARARQIAREHVGVYLRLAPHQQANLRRLGFTDADLADGGSDRLVESIVAFGGEEAIADRVRQHHQAGADHVCLQVLDGADERLPRAEWRRLADILR
ncbi:TIGR03620 family F420-dependent LLM class oxidoreductase [Goodfellowiella coeruleoviolacea]|uniref:F420-dependent oxidoreductase, MSMEG_4141 family n=1 Tax=Goodfellowiella coeruleoviolacea TaxID=334858 RepID=A0AAE3KGC6_9PSEU|nr:TIGR03620 family F420-dependent LLM class oxidoreductase [Goodfellowiella coeruleoviolacea]MCP2165349.1 putative F420-dependent oxidoreductase, MSMEG_4141 family [Goodfellowiella coeruleoviolacea]